MQSQKPTDGSAAAVVPHKVPTLRTMMVRGRAYAVVKFKGRRYTFGRADDPAHLRRYQEFAAHVFKHGVAPEVSQEPAPYLVRDLVVDALDHFATYYRNPDGSQGGEYVNLRTALQHVLDQFGELPAEKFGPLSLQQVRQGLLASGRYCRKEINARVHRIRRAFKWAAANERIAGTVVHGLATVDGLKAGRCGARESEPVRPVPYEHVLAVLPHLPPTVAAMVKLQALTAARPDEVCGLRMRNLDRTGKVWIATLEHHKNAWRGHTRTLRLDSFAQDVIRPYLRPSPDAFLFSPATSEQERHEEQRQLRKTKVSPSQQQRAERARQRDRQRAPRDNYDVNSYRQAIQRACAAASSPARHAAILEAIPQDVRAHVEKVVARLPIVLTEQRLARAVRTVAERNKLDNAKAIVKLAVEALRNHVDAVPAWAPNQLRHSGATVARKLEGLDGSQVLLGHKKADVTQVYAELEEDRGVAVAEKVGAEIARRLRLAQ